jgi:hypothetical protein
VLPALLVRLELAQQELQVLPVLTALQELQELA